MSSRSGSRSRRQRSREPHEDFPSLPAPRLPSLRALAAQRDRDNGSPATSNRLQTRSWANAVSRRAERIRSLDENSSLGDFQRALDHVWGTAPFARSERPQVNSEARTANLDGWDREVDEANSQIRALLEATNTTSFSPLLTPSTNSFPSGRTFDYMDDHRRNKRRKLDSEKRTSNCKAFRYGTYGQVEPGQLRMEISSCDGGMFSNESSYAAENILKNDNTVYCTKGNRCNIVLRHEGGTAFTLQELVIKGPTSMNYSHPIREGMVFVTMREDEVLKRTAQYQIQYAPMGRDPSWSGQEERASERDVRQVLSIRHHDDGSTSTRVRRSYFPRSEHDDYRIAQMPQEFTTSLPNVGVTTECSDEDEENLLDGGRRQPRRTPNRIGSLPFETADSDEDEEYDANILDFSEFMGGPARPAQQTTSSMSLNEAWEASTNATQEAVRAVGGELLAPHARFFIEKKKSTCTIRFDPPVSGRFILLKMWNSHHDPKCNIDIQSVIAKGYAGPRYFPSFELA